MIKSICNFLQERISFPRDLDQLQEIRKVFEEYSTNSLGYTLVFFASAYLYKQSFAIPGSVFMNLLSGALFGVVNGFILCCVLSAFGASSCFLLSKTFGKAILLKFAPNKIDYFRSMVIFSLADILIVLFYLMQMKRTCCLFC